MQHLNGPQSSGPQSPAVHEALRRLVTAPPGMRREYAPGVADAIGEREFHRVLDWTAQQLGDFVAVEDGPEGLVLRGSRGSVLAWGVVADDGTLAGFRISPLRRSGGPSSAYLVMFALLAAVLAGAVWNCWRAGTATGWAAGLAWAGIMWVYFEGFLCPASISRTLRLAFAAGAAAAAVSAVRLPGMRLGGQAPWAAAAGAAFLLLVGYVTRARLRRWGTPASVPLRFPLPGRWIVGQGGGRGINHHSVDAAQRGAVDLIRTGPLRRPGALEDYPAYGAPVSAPCDGVVVRAADGMPDQPVGRPRLGPLAGNHVTIDTGAELVHLAHLRSGTVRVAVGDRVAAGDPLGEVGNSGNTSEPHLHLHAERDGVGLDLVFQDVRGRLYRGRTVRGRA